jgi:cysteine desulfurase
MKSVRWHAFFIPTTSFLLLLLLLRKGSIQPIEEIVQLCREYGPSDLLIHTDASQSLGKVPIDVTRLGVDLLTICSHKFHGPKGIGALYIRDGVHLQPILHGAQHERGLRPGTENVLGIVGLAKACQSIAKKGVLNGRIAQMTSTRDRLYQGLIEQLNQEEERRVIRNGSEEHCLPNTLNISLVGINAKQLVQQLSERLAFSTGSACHEDTKCPTMSTTLQAIGKVVFLFNKRLFHILFWRFVVGYGT